MKIYCKKCSKEARRGGHLCIEEKPSLLSRMPCKAPWICEAYRTVVLQERILPHNLSLEKLCCHQVLHRVRKLLWQKMDNSVVCGSWTCENICHLHLSVQIHLSVLIICPENSYTSVYLRWSLAIFCQWSLKMLFQ